jgi:RNA recognition motif-containing protein
LGLAFANFNSAEEAKAAVNSLNGYELLERTLRVELRKMLSPEEEQQKRQVKQLRKQRIHPYLHSTKLTQLEMSEQVLLSSIKHGNSCQLPLISWILNYDRVLCIPIHVPLQHLRPVFSPFSMLIKRIGYE